MAKKSIKNTPTDAKKPEPKKSELDNLTLTDGKTHLDPDIEKVKKDRLDKESVRKEILPIYSAFTTEDKKPLPKFDDFERDIVPSILKSLYDKKR